MPKRITSIICTAVLCMVTNYGARAGSIPSVEQTAREQFEKVKLEWKENFSGRTVPGLIALCEPGRPVRAKLMTIEDWKALGPVVQEEILDYECYGYKTISAIRYVRIEKLRKYLHRRFALLMRDFLGRHCDTEIAGDDHTTVGAIQVTVNIYELPDNSIIGGSVHFFQEGCDMPDAGYGHFNTEEEAKKAGCVFSDVSWSASGLFNYDLRPFYYSDYMEWTGY